MTNLQIPLVLDFKGNLIEPNVVEKNGEYYCPLCFENVFFRSGVNKYFFHKHPSQCSPDEVLHQSAKLLIVKAIFERNFEATKQIQIKKRRYGCDDDLYGLLADDFNVAKLDVRVDINFVADICLFKNGTPALAIELISNRQKVDERIRAITIPFVILDVNDIIKDKFNWLPTDENYLTCRHCE